MSVKQRLQAQFLQNWSSRLDNSSRAGFYKHFAVFMFQPYLDTLNLARFRICSSLLRMSSHRLFIETGRWRKPVSVPIDDRKCIACNKLEDEYHFVNVFNIVI